MDAILITAASGLVLLLVFVVWRGLKRKRPIVGETSVVSFAGGGLLLGLIVAIGGTIIGCIFSSDPFCGVGVIILPIPLMLFGATIGAIIGSSWRSMQKLKRQRLNLHKEQEKKSGSERYLYAFLAAGWITLFYIPVRLFTQGLGYNVVPLWVIAVGSFLLFLTIAWLWRRKK
ncbi:MAG TPA: hypothetical protein VGA53_00425 [Candidatus Paceibacterota bacterium]